jgi:hypothetical protein
MTGFVTRKFRAILAIDIPQEGKRNVHAEISKRLHHIKAEFSGYAFP